MTNTPDKSVKAEYVLGPVHECDELSGDEGELWQAEVQLFGGYAVAATIYAGSEDAARRMAEQAIAAWNAPSLPADQVPDRDGLAESLKARLASRYNVTSNTIPVSRTEVERIIAALQAVPASGEVGESDGVYEIGKRDGYENAVQDIDLLTGGDGEYRYCMNAHDSDRHCPDAEAMKARIADRFAALQAVPAEVGEKESVYRDIFAEITAKAQPLCEDESDPEKITGYRLPVGPLHRAAGKTGFQMFNGEAHLARAVRDIDRLKTTLKQVKVLLISAASRDSHMAPEYERRKAREATDVIDTALKASGEE